MEIYSEGASLNSPIQTVTMQEVKREDRDRLKIVVAGLGNAGGQAAYRAYMNGFPSIVMNTSEKDVSNDVLMSDIPAIIVGDGRGAAKDRTISKGFLKENLNSVFQEKNFVSLIEDADVVVVVASLGGGTGSGFMGLLANRIQVKYPATTVICFGIAPKMNEAGQAHMNKIEVIDELNKLKLPFTLLDLATLEDVPNNKAFEMVGNQFVEDLKIIRGDYSKMTTTGMIDAREWLTLFNNGGYFITTSVSNLTDRDIEKESIQSRLINNLKDGNIHARINGDKNIRYIGAIANFTSTLEDPMKAGNFSEMNNYLGRPVDMFSNFTSDNKSTDVHLVITGLSIPVETIDASKAIIMEYSLVNKKNVDLSSDREEVSFFSQANTRDKGKLLGKGTSEVTDISDDIPDFL